MKESIGKSLPNNHNLRPPVQCASLIGSIIRDRNIFPISLVFKPVFWNTFRDQVIVSSLCPVFGKSHIVLLASLYIRVSVKADSDPLILLQEGDQPV